MMSSIILVCYVHDQELENLNSIKDVFIRAILSFYITRNFKRIQNAMYLFFLNS